MDLYTLIVKNIKKPQNLRRILNEHQDALKTMGQPSPLAYALTHHKDPKIRLDIILDYEWSKAVWRDILYALLNKGDTEAFAKIPKKDISKQQWRALLEKYSNPFTQLDFPSSGVDFNELTTLLFNQTPHQPSKTPLDIIEDFFARGRQKVLERQAGMLESIIDEVFSDKKEEILGRWVNEGRVDILEYTKATHSLSPEQLVSLVPRVEHLTLLTLQQKAKLALACEGTHKTRRIKI